MWKSGKGTPPTPLQLRRLRDKIDHASEATPMSLGLDAYPPSRSDYFMKLLAEEDLRPEPKPNEDLIFRKLCERQIESQYRAGQILPLEISIFAFRR